MKTEFKKLDLNQYKPLGEIVFDYLRDAIMNGELKPGQRLMENTIAEQLGVSRTPVREAIRKLEKENFITMVPRKGAYVSRLTAKEILDVLEVRRVLEGFAADLAAQRMSDAEKKELRKSFDRFQKFMEKANVQGMIEKDREFHDLIFKATQNGRLISLVKELHEQFHRFRLIYFNEFSNYEDIQNWHSNILLAIENKDAEEAKKQAEGHVAEVERAVVEWAESEGKSDEKN
ncbi:MAG: GntR family transcriptional regulator [Clostridiales bacterium]|nr:GntR family transcriptional regulator [Clostridiales bacterium]